MKTQIFLVCTLTTTIFVATGDCMCMVLQLSSVLPQPQIFLDYFLSPKLIENPIFF